MEEVHEKMTREPCAPERTSDVWSTTLPKWTLGFLCLVMISSSAAIYTKHYFYSVHVRQNTDAMKLIRNFILQHNESMETLKDSDILHEVEKMICQVAQIYQERAEIQTLIEDTLAMINHGWTVINGSLYYVFSDLVMFYEAQKTCESINTTLAIVIHPQVELFLESQSKKLNQGIWIGLQFLEKNWQWIDGKTPYHSQSNDRNLAFGRPGSHGFRAGSREERKAVKRPGGHHRPELKQPPVRGTFRPESPVYVNLEGENVNSLERSMNKLKTSLVTGIKDIKLNYKNSMNTAEEILNLPTHLEKAAKALRGIKEKYQSIFRKNVRSAGGWQFWGRSLYYFSKGQKSWYDAENFCMSRDAHLASILHDKEQNYITSQLAQTAWVGLSVENEESGWEWTDRSTLTAGFWSSESPSHSSRYRGREQDCVSVVPSLGNHNWKAADCHELYRWVCKENLEHGEP